MRINKKIYKIDDFILNTQTRQFFHNKESVQLSSRAFDILLYLIQKRGEIVEKEDIIEAVWSDSFVEENNLAVHISALRRLLNEKRGETRFIKTVSGRGYSFIAPIEEVDSANKKQPSEEFVVDTNNKEYSIAILPFTMDEFDSDVEYLVNGLTQGLISDLSQIPNLKVMAYSAVRKYRDSNHDLQEIGFLLGVNQILTGHISSYKENLEINVELIDTSDKSHLWGLQDRFEFNDLLSIKKNISEAIAEKLRISLPDVNKRKLDQQKEIDFEAYKLYLKGKYIIETISTRNDLKKDLNQALRFFKRAIKKDSNYALAYTGMGEAYIQMFHNNVLSKADSYAEAKKALQLALSLDDKLSEAHALKGTININFEHDLIEANKSLKHAVKLNTNNPDSYQWLSFIHLCLGDFETSLSYQKKAVRLDPTSIPYNNGLLRIFYYSEDYNKAIVQAEEILELDNRSVPAYYFLGMIYAELGLFEEALSYNETADQLRPSSPVILLGKAYIYVLKGNKSEAMEILSDILENYSAGDYDPSNIATVYSAMEDYDNAFAALDKAFEQGSLDLKNLKVNPKLKKLRDDKRFDKLLKKLNL